MEAKLQALCEQFILNRDLIRQNEKWCSTYLPPVCAHLFCAQGKTVDTERLKTCHDLLKERTGIFSNFRSTMETAFVCMLALEEDPEAVLEKTLTAYELLKREFFSSQYLSLAAYMLKDEADLAGVVARGRRIYEAMRKEHPFLTSSEDSVFAAMLARSEKSDGELIDDMEACYAPLKDHFGSGNSVQTVSHVLSLTDGLPRAIADRFIELFESLRRAGIKYSKYYELPTLAALSLMPVDIRQVTADMQEVDAWLTQQKGYGFWGLPRSSRLMHAAMIVSTAYAADPSVGTAAFTGTLSMIISQQVATMSAIGAAAAVNAAASN